MFVLGIFMDVLLASIDIAKWRSLEYVALEPQIHNIMHRPQNLDARKSEMRGYPHQI